MKKTTALFWSALVLAVLMSGCTDSPKEEQEKEQPEFVEVEGKKFRGGVFRLNENEYVQSLFPHTITDAVSARVSGFVYEGLMGLDPSSLELVPALATSINIDTSGKIYTLSLKKGVTFHDDPCFTNGKGRAFTAQDVVFCFDLLRHKSKDNHNYRIIDNVLGGDSTHKAIDAVDDHTVVFRLKERNSVFKYLLAEPMGYIFPREAYEKYGHDMNFHTVGTGPFILHRELKEDFKDEEKIVLRANPSYHRSDEEGNQLPLLSGIEISFVADKMEEMTLFKEGHFDMIYRLPTMELMEVLEHGENTSKAYNLEDIPEMSTHLLGFNHTNALNSDLNFRKALAYAIDRNLIVNKILDGEADLPGHYGITPAAFKDYHIQEIKGYKLNLDSARYYLKNSSFSSLRKDKTIVIETSSDGERNSKVLLEIKRQLEDNLNIKVITNQVTLSTHADNIEQGTADIFLYGWLYDYPNPENFLNTFYSSEAGMSEGENSYPNFHRYVNPAFDKLYQEAVQERITTKYYSLYHQAEQLLIDDCASIPLWYDEGYRILQPSVRDLPLNAMQIRDLSKTYFAQPEAIAQQ